MLMKQQQGFAHLWLVLVFVLVFIGGVGWAVYQRQSSKELTTTNSESSSSAKEQPASAKKSEPDSADTLSSPEKITSADGKSYFVYGAPAGQNNKQTKKLIISLPGHGTTADTGYVAWKGHIEGGEYALAEFNWWRGTGEKKTDYYDPPAVVAQVRAFLNKQGYDSGDTVVLHGFSRGSANTYAVVVQDHLLKEWMIDAVISNAGKYQSDFPLADHTLSDQEITRLFKDVPWVLACGGLDENPQRDGCPGMQETQSFLTSHGANVLGLLTDPNKGHGAFHQSSLKLPAQALALIDGAL